MSKRASDALRRSAVDVELHEAMKARVTDELDRFYGLRVGPFDDLFEKSQASVDKAGITSQKLNSITKRYGNIVDVVEVNGKWWVYVCKQDAVKYNNGAYCCTNIVLIIALAVVASQLFV